MPDPAPRHVSEDIDHDAHICTKACVDAHITGCQDCKAFEDGFWLCRRGAEMDQKYLKDRMVTR